MAEVLVRHLIEEDPMLNGHVIVTSAATSKWHLGSEMDPRARRALDRAGYHLEGSKVTYADGEYLREQDLILVMTREHVYDVRDRLHGTPVELELWRNLSEPGLNLDLADPYYGDDDEFDECLASLAVAKERLTDLLRTKVGARRRVG